MTHHSLLHGSLWPTNLEKKSEALYCLYIQFEEPKPLSKEEKAVEAERVKKMQEEVDLKLAKEAFGMLTFFANHRALDKHFQGFS